MSEIWQRRAVVNLGPWLELCERMGVPYVPAEFSESFPVVEMYALIDSHGDEPVMMVAPLLERAFQWLGKQRVQANTENAQIIARWECCSSVDTKSMMAHGGGWHRDMTFLELDERVFDCLASEHLRMCVRPWVEALRMDGYPVEFRVFFGADGYQGVSSYYPQRPLPETPQVMDAVMVCHAFANTLYQAGEFPVGFSADFLLTEEGKVLFLEGGPPHVLGPVSAHPCCFAPGRIDGIALERREGSLRA